MSKITEIKASLSELSTKELLGIERSIHELYKQRNETIIYDDSYGVWTETDQASAASKVFAILED
jgi:hypothetical protein